MIRHKVGGCALAALMLASQVAATALADERPGTRVTLKTAYHTTFDVYVAGDREAPRGALLVPDRWGMNRNVLDWADRLAARGYRVVAVDYFDGRPVRNAVMAREVIRSIDPVWVEADLDSALAYLRLQPRRIVAVTWGEGGAHALRLARRHEEAIQALVFYRERAGRGLDAVAELTIPVLEVATARSLLDVSRHGDTAAGEAWRATAKFLESNFE